VKRAVLLVASLLAACGAGVPFNDAGTEPGDGGSSTFDGGMNDSGVIDTGINDAGPNDGGASDAGTPASRCTVTPQRAECSSQTTSLTGLVVPRAVTFEAPLGSPPAQGWPTVLFFQGSLVPGSQAFANDRGASFGMYQLTRTVKALLDRGFAVIAPDAIAGGTIAWQTNIPPWSIAWTTSSDHALMLKLFDAIAAGDFGPLDSSRLYAMGISSGGYMSSRMAVSYPGKFRALVIHSASYATCSNTCSLPATLPADHPPTLFVHGQVDMVAPIATMLPYRAQLASMGIAVSSDISPDAGHEWLESAAASVPAWFEQH
jgi:dienelactone hydrolase